MQQTSGTVIEWVPTDDFDRESTEQRQDKRPDQHQQIEGTQRADFLPAQLAHHQHYCKYSSRNRRQQCNNFEAELDCERRCRSRQRAFLSGDDCRLCAAERGIPDREAQCHHQQHQRCYHQTQKMAARFGFAPMSAGHIFQEYHTHKQQQLGGIDVSRFFGRKIERGHCCQQEERKMITLIQITQNAVEREYPEQLNKCFIAGITSIEKHERRY